MKHCAYGLSVATLLNLGGATTVSHKYSLTVVRHATVVAAVPSTVNYSAIRNKLYYFKRNLNV
jgi:glycine cleavage system regulatory protein